ncbi:PP2C family serine/threonine-protein phosphatase [Pedobacter sp. SYSU D00535]|uniref:PP2C family protein-serine/threonine phosphatase n=1 Tax=Pedobacter sp. SYSU D00535 TaxID=2810308 RepID=UPI001A979F58|nr:protein phosphatase 2C domain-containing protein [Pedobacter sp. SYSU D00535]
MAENFFGITDTGKLRDNNEDTFIAEKAMGDRFIIACVIDGVGGYVGGEVAAAIAKDAIQRHLKEPVSNIINTMKEAFSSANERIQEEKQQIKQYDKMACVLTLAVVDVENNLFYYAHVGDTRLYLLRDHSLVKVTKDHSFVGFLEDSGRLSEESAMKHPKRNEINKALGFGQQIQLQKDYIETGQSPFLPGDTLLLCSDGLTDLVNKHEITSILSSASSLEQKGNQLVSAANQNGGKDNITVVLVHNSKKPVKAKVIKPPKNRQVKRPLNEAKPQPVSVPPQVIVSKPLEGQPVQQPVKKSYNPYVFVLAGLCLIFLLVIIFLLTNRGGSENEKAPTPDTTEQSATEEGMASDSLILMDTTKRVDPVIE